MRHGIENEQCLEGLAGMSSDYQNAFFGRSLGLNTFQMLCVQDALRKRRVREIIYID